MRYPEGEGPADYHCHRCGGTIYLSLNPCTCGDEAAREDNAEQVSLFTPEDLDDTSQPW